jgi:inosose dehydratase
VVNYLDKPLALKKLMDDAGLQMASCSNGGGPDFSGNFYDPAKTPKTIADHIKFARDFIKPFGYCNHFKMNNGPRPAGYDVSDDQIKVCADALNAIGKETIKFGIRLAPHPHVGSLIQNEHETRKLMELTDPRYVWLTTDTSHLTLGGMDPLQIMKDYWPRVAEVHYKDAPTHLRGNKVVAVPKSGPESGGHGWFRNLGGDKDRPDSNGVDFPAIQKFLIEKNFTGWVTLDLDASMIPKGSNMEQTIKGNLKYLVDVLHVDPATV